MGYVLPRSRGPKPSGLYGSNPIQQLGGRGGLLITLLSQPVKGRQASFNEMFSEIGEMQLHNEHHFRRRRERNVVAKAAP